MNRFLEILAVVVFLSLGVIGSESLWIDEGDSAIYAIQPTFSKWWEHLNSDKNADCQMPLYMGLLWGWEKLAGRTEYAFRALNILFALGALWSLFWAGRILKMPFLWGLLFVQPYFYFYLNEARPYLLLLSLGCGLIASLCVLFSGHRSNTGAWLVFLGCFVGLNFSSILAPAVVLPATLLAVGGLVTHKFAATRGLIWLATTAVALSALAGYFYFTTLLRGAQGAQLWDLSILNLGWLGYEFFGAVGLGPSIYDIRGLAQSLHGLRILAPLALPLSFVGLCSFSIVVGLAAAWYRRLVPRWLIVVPFFILLMEFLVLFGAGYFLHKAFWARHLAPVFGCYIILQAVALHALWSTNGLLRWVGRGVALLVVTCLICSSARVMWSPVHAKDDYRAAAAAARADLNTGRIIWWGGSWHCAAFYGLPAVDEKSLSPDFILIRNKDMVTLSSLPEPDLIVLSRPDIYDDKGAIRAFASQAGLHPEPDAPHNFILFRSQKP